MLRNHLFVSQEIGQRTRWAELPHSQSHGHHKRITTYCRHLLLVKSNICWLMKSNHRRSLCVPQNYTAECRYGSILLTSSLYEDEWTASTTADFTLLYPLNRRLGGPESRCKRFREEKLPFSWPESSDYCLVFQSVFYCLYRLCYPTSCLITELCLLRHRQGLRMCESLPTQTAGNGKTEGETWSKSF
jgi:hypothetical protein